MSFSLSDCSDGELAALALAGRQAAYRELLARHREAVFRLVRATIGDPAEAIDVTQEAFISAFAALKRYDPDRPFIAWLKRIALNKCRDWARRRSVRRFFSFALPIEAAETVSDDSIPADQQLADRAELARVREGITRLPPAIREPLILRTIEGLTQSETAEILGISEKAVETRVYRARRALQADVALK